jgi:lipoyl-dependent peroxiredoxin
MKFTRKANAHWTGSGKEGKGTLTTNSLVLNKTAYSYSKRFENEPGTNPEELIGAAHAGCFTMQLSFLLGAEGFHGQDMETVANVTFEDGSITLIHLELSARVEGISPEKFQEIATKAKEICPVSKLLNATITLTATLL